MYGIPCNADGVLRVDISALFVNDISSSGKEAAALATRRAAEGGGAVITKEGDLGLDAEKWEGGVVGRDGNMYCVPQMASHVLRIKPSVPSC